MTHMDDSIFTKPAKFDPTRFDHQATTIKTRTDHDEQAEGTVVNYLGGPCYDELHDFKSEKSKQQNKNTTAYYQTRQSLIQPDSRTKLQFHLTCFIPPGAGPRICPGYEFARIETLTINVAILVSPDIAKCPERTEHECFGEMPYPGHHTFT
ncbi:hypothetical protein SADUNF_Sadunf16G0286000 [Salix dunnii]|uniref:Cytochrome P450 n=1 Tax=Salix dunnii TaxID=1413687 RepID=A0A835JCR2_9ROSI|nr:hypothetical protein SADUNF_Sadunf16G0286000 [Salix dunnii]